MWPFTKKVPTGMPPPIAGPGFAVAHGDGGNPYTIAAPTYADSIGSAQDHPQVPYDRRTMDSDPTQNPQAYYDRRNGVSQGRNRRHWAQTPPQYYAPAHENNEAPNPWYGGAPMPPRPSSFLSPAGSHFLTLPNQEGLSRVAKHLNGSHFSMASNRRAYPIGGMQPRRTWRNTYRADPVSRDEQTPTDTGPEKTAVRSSVTEFVSPVAPAIRRTFRL